MMLIVVPSVRIDPHNASIAIIDSVLYYGMAKVHLSSGRGRNLVLAMMAWLIISAVPFVAMAGETQPSEYQVKAAYLYNFAKFIEWPPGTGGQQNTFTICVLGRNPFGDAMDAIAGKTVHNQKVVVRYIRSADEIKGCEMLFISSYERENVAAIIAELSSMSGVLTISDGKRFIRAGGMIGFVTIDNRVRFEINNKAARQADVQISSQLLKLAITVEP